jgi:hypothetical protein
MATAPEAVSRLDRRPEARSFSVEDLLQEIKAGRIRIPRFQRGLRWEDSDRVKLFDSIYRGFPIGTLLFWKRAAEAGPVQFGRFVVDAEARSDALWVVDGQQRITTLAEVLLVDSGSDPGGRTIRFDLEDKLFAYGTTAQEPAPRWLPLSEVSDSVRLLTWAHQHTLSDFALHTALDLGKRIREYQAPAYIVETEDEAILRGIFDRSNSSGKALTAAEIFNALHGAQAAEKPATLRDLADDLEDMAFGRIPEKIILRALLAVRRKDPGRDFRQIPTADVPAALAETLSALRQAIAFFKKAGFPHIELLPYKLPLATLALFFHEHRDANPRTHLLLSRWLWRGAISGAHRGDTVALRRTLDAIQPQDEEGSVQSLLAEAGERPAAPPILRPLNYRHAQTKLLLVALAARGPRHLLSGAPIGVAELIASASGPGMRIFTGAPAPEADGLANRLLHPPIQGGDPTRVRVLAACADQDVLSSHLVSEEAHHLLRQNDAAGFLRCRELDLGKYIQQFLDARAEWDPGDRDRPSLAALVVADDDE